MKRHEIVKLLKNNPMTLENIQQHFDIDRRFIETVLDSLTSKGEIRYRNGYYHNLNDRDERIKARRAAYTTHFNTLKEGALHMYHRASRA